MPVTPGRPTTSARWTGQILWQLGGKDSSFTAQAAPGQVLDTANEIFAWQHDPEALGQRHVYLLRQRVVRSCRLLPYSRAVTVKLNFQRPHRDAHCLRRSAGRTLGRIPGQCADDPASATSSSGGAHCPTSRSSAPPGKLLFNAEFPAGVNTYRAYLLPWNPSSRIGVPGRQERLTRHRRTCRRDRRRVISEPTPSAEGWRRRVVKGRRRVGRLRQSLGRTYRLLTGRYPLSRTEGRLGADQRSRTPAPTGPTGRSPPAYGRIISW